MRRETKQILTGGVTLIGLALAFAYSYAGKQATSQAVGMYPVTATFSRVDGLYAGDDVFMAGIKIGTVNGMVLDDNFRAVVTLHIKDGIELPVDSAAAIHTDGLFGAKSVMVEPGGEMELLQAGSTIEYTQGSVVVSELLELIISEGKARMAEPSPKGEE